MQNGPKRIMNEKTFGSKGKILRKISIFYENIGENVQYFFGYPCKNVTCIFFHLFFSFSEKKLFWLRPGGLRPPHPPVYGLARNL